MAAPAAAFTKLLPQALYSQDTPNQKPSTLTAALRYSLAKRGHQFGLQRPLGLPEVPWSPAQRTWSIVVPSEASLSWFTLELKTAFHPKRSSQTSANKLPLTITLPEPSGDQLARLFRRKRRSFLTPLIASGERKYLQLEIDMLETALDVMPSRWLKSRSLQRLLP